MRARRASTSVVGVGPGPERGEQVDVLAGPHVTGEGPLPVDGE